MKSEVINLSVRGLVEFIYRHGSIESGLGGMSSAREGVKIHQLIQKDLKDQSKASENMEYLNEIFLSHSFEFNNLCFKVEGRADGIIIKEGGVTIIEIKSTSKDIRDITEDFNPLHWAQAKIYAYIYALQNSLETITVQLIYCDRDKHYTKTLEQALTITEASEFFNSVIKDYLKWGELASKWLKTRNTSIETMSFPFENYRKGQRELAANIYSTIKEGKNIYIEAPTGIGKTLSTIFPAVKALGYGYGEKIIYLTAKNTTQQLVESTISLLKDKNLELKLLTLTAKEKICFNDEFVCDKESCIYANGHFDRVNDGIYKILTEENFLNRETIEKYSREFTLCPFEFSLDLINFCDFIIGDYNYFFDPRVMLKRAGANEGYVFLVDEAHNLVDRARGMYSVDIMESRIALIKKKLGRKGKKLRTILNALLEIFYEYSDKREQYVIIDMGPADMALLMRDFVNELEGNLKLKEELFLDEEFVDIYFNFIQFINISEFYNEEFITYGESYRDDFRIKIFCLNPTKVIKQCIKSNRANIFFSATLSPLSYFKELLGGELNDYEIKLLSPFKKENRKIIIGNNIDTRYRFREKSYDPICKYINRAVTLYNGNFMVFFPSYEYLLRVHEVYVELFPNHKVIIQQNSMNEEEREDFLNNFNNYEENIIAFCVLGGIFSEGIDLTGDKLVGAIIIGVGLPQISFERSSIENYFNDLGKMGFHYSYTFPGINKVIQAAGRVIRTEQDKGVILLLDSRYDTPFYKKLLPKDWEGYSLVKKSADMDEILDDFK